MSKQIMTSSKYAVKGALLVTCGICHGVSPLNSHLEEWADDDHVDYTHCYCLVNVTDENGRFVGIRRNRYADWLGRQRGAR